MINWEVFAQVAGSVAAGATFIGWLIRNFKLDMIDRFNGIDRQFDKMDQDIDRRGNDVHERFNKIDARFDKVDAKFEKIEADLTELKQGQAFLEAANIYTMPSEPSKPNARSQAARELWRRRRQKKLESKTK